MPERRISRQHVIAKLLMSAIYFDDDEYWRVLLDDRPTLFRYFEDMGVRLEVDTEMGMGYLRPTNPEEEEEFALAGYAPLPKIIPPKFLGYLPSVMCALLREALQRHEENSVEAKHLYLDEGQLIEFLRPYIAETQDEKALKREVKKVVARVEEIGVLKRVANRSDVLYRVEPIIRARIPLSHLQELLARLKDPGGSDSSEETARGDNVDKEQP
jgi:hypothetical protein